MRKDPPVQGDERAMLVGWLNFHRETLAMKVDGLSAETFASRPIPNSPMSLLGLIRHLTEIERTYFRVVFGGEELPALAFGDDPFGETTERDWMTASAAPPEVAISAWRAEREAAARIADATASLDDTGQSGLPLRFWLVKTLNEYARHNGHADIIRELLDGEVGE